MSVKDLISAAFNKDANSFESTLHAIMQEKMSAAIQARFSPAVYEEEVDLDEAKDDSEDDESTEEDDDEEDMKEEVEELDELSKKTLGSYISKASDNATVHGMKYGEKKAQSDEMDRMMNRHMSYSDKDQVRKIMKTTSDDVDAPRRKAAKRLKGIDLAVKKISK